MPEHYGPRATLHTSFRRWAADGTFDREAYKHRNVVERCFNRLKRWRGVATRYNKTAQSYKAAVSLASLLVWA